jgi:hypothetical protein
MPRGNVPVSLTSDYLKLGGQVADLKGELTALIGKYNEQRDTYLFVYAACPEKATPLLPLSSEDYYVIRDLLAAKKGLERLDFYIETLGGSGEAAEEIVRFLHENFGTVSFVVCGEAKSAGTIMVLSGEEILMTETGSLGPIDAQVEIGRSTMSAYDYMEWVRQKRDEAETKGRLNPFDATMVAQIAPGELEGVSNALDFAKDLVVDWLPKYKFRNWDVTEKTSTPVTPEMRKKRAEEIAKELINHSKWRSHARSIKVSDLEEIGLRVTRIDDTPELADIVYRIHTVTRILFQTSSIFKLLATQDDALFRQATPKGPPPVQLGPLPMKAADVVGLDITCPKCGKTHQIYAKLSPIAEIDREQQAKGLSPFPVSQRILCDCGFEIDLSGVRAEIELETGKKVLTE